MRADVQHYYGEVLQSSSDLKTSACCTVGETPDHVSAALAEIHVEVATRYYGCGLVLPEALVEAQILDLGCGAGRDCYLLSRLVGPEGHVVGVDMTPGQLEVARRHRDYHAERFGYESSNVRFIEGDIESLETTGLAAASFDVIVSNCVINLATDKRAVFDQAYRLLKPGGEIYFADIYSDRRIPEHLKADPVLYGECLSGALYWNDFIELVRQAGFIDPRLVEDRPVTVDDPVLAEKLGEIRFFSATCRLFKLPELEPGHEDYGQRAVYRGTVPHLPGRLRFDKHNVFETDKPQSVCANTYRMLKSSRLAPFFEFHGDARAHQGTFEAESAGLPFDDPDSQSVDPARKSPGTSCC